MIIPNNPAHEKYTKSDIIPNNSVYQNYMWNPIQAIQVVEENLSNLGTACGLQYLYSKYQNFQKTFVFTSKNNGVERIGLQEGDYLVHVSTTKAGYWEYKVVPKETFELLFSLKKPSRSKKKTSDEKKEDASV